MLDDEGTVVLHRNMRTEPDALKRALAPYRERVVKAIQGGKAKNDRIDSEKIARLLRGGTFPLAHAHPKEMRGTRDLLRRRNQIGA